MMAEDEQAIVGIELLVGPGRDLAHGNQGAALDMGGLVLPGFSHIDQLCFPLLQERGRPWQ